ncbi:MAG: hypothetical protein R2817_03185 [Flavobacteriales bacterium]
MKRWIGIAALVLVAAIWWTITHLHDHLAITSPSGARTAVVEGWMPRDRMPALVQLLEEEGYDRIYVTGTTRLFAYYLEQDQALRVDFPGPTGGELLVNASGIDGSRLLLLTANDTLMDLTLSGTPTAYRGTLPKGASSLLLRSLHPRALEPGTKNLFVKELLLNGTNAHALASTCALIRADSTVLPAAPTFAEWGAWLLNEGGIPAERTVAVPATVNGIGRTLANARAFAAQAQADGLTAVDLISLGVHARRSQRVYQEACGDRVRVGVRALADPDTPREGWWRSSLGIVRVLKELVGIPATEVLEGSMAP